VKLAVRVAAAAGVAALAGLLVWHLTHRPASVAKAVARGKIVPAPAFDLPRLDGDGKLALASLRGKAVVVNFWASDCQPCKQEMPRLERYATRYSGKGVVFLGVDIADGRAAARSFVKRYHATYLMVFDQLANTAAPWGIIGTPMTFFLDRRGRIVHHVLGPVSASDLDEGIASALAT
jgi:cytochrome c biogenesis protein CcmG, thiol:disulfide interchange protein DsbE